MRKFAASIVALLALSAPLALGQVSPEDAAAKLRQKTEQRAAASTQPTGVAELARLRTENARLTKELAEAKADSAKLAEQIRTLQAKIPAAPVKSATAWRTALKIGMTEEEADTVFQTIPGRTNAYEDTVTETGKTIVWKESITQYRNIANSQGTASIPTGGKDVRLATLHFRNGKLSAIDY